MEITDIRMNLLDNAGGVKAIGSFSLDNSFAVRGMRVMEDKKGEILWHSLQENVLMEIMKILHFHLAKSSIIRLLMLL